MPQERPAIDDSPLTRGAREEMIEGPSGVEHEALGLRLRIVNLPLFRRSEDGGLLQTLRVIAWAGSGAGEVTFSVSEGGKVLDRATARVGEGRTLVHLFVPEVREARTLVFEVTDGKGGRSRAAVEVRPQRKWSVYVVHHSHLDIGYTDPQASVLGHHLHYLDSVLDLASATDDWPEDARFRWNVEATWPLGHWLKSRPKADGEEFFRRARQGRVEVCALPFSMHTEAYSTDELARQLAYADELRERHGVPVTTAMQTDVPGATIGLLSALLDADVRYLSVAHNYAGRSVPHLVGGQGLSRPFYWQAPNGERLLVWYTDTPHGLAYMEGNFVGLAADYETTVGVLPGYLGALAERPYPYEESLFGWAGMPAGFEVTKTPYPHDILHIRVQGALADNASPSIVPAEIAREWNERWAYPQLRLATNREFFEAAEERLGDRLETFSGDWTDWWVDGVGSAARPLGLNRRAQAGIRTARTIHALADVLADDGVGVSDAVDAAYEDMALFDEHTWGAANPWDDDLDGLGSGAVQWAKKAAFAREAHDRTGALVEAGAVRLSRVLGSSAPSLASVAVFNPSRWERTDLVRVFVPWSRIGAGSRFAVVEAATGERVPHVAEVPENPAHRPLGDHVSFVARDVPSYGYARYDLVEEAGEPDDPEPEDGPVLENEHYRVRLGLPEGEVAELVDKDSGKDLVNGDAPFGFNRYIYDRYTSAPHFNHLSGRILATDLSLLGERSVAGHGVVTGRSSNAVWDRITVRLVGEGANFVETTLTLPRGVKRLDVKNRVSKIGTPDKESVYFAFPFDLDDPSVRYEITGGTDSPDWPRVPGSADHMRAVRHWAVLEDATTKVAWATLEAPLVQLGNIHLPYAPFPKTIDDREAHPATVYSWALNNLWDTNFPPRQGGEMEFRYAISTGDATTEELGMRTAAALTAPLLGVLCKPDAAGDLPDRGSFCSVDRPDVEVVALAPSRRGHDLVVFLQSLAPDAAEARLSFPLLPVEKAWLGTHLERRFEEVAVDGGEARFVVPAGAYVSLALDLADGV